MKVGDLVRHHGTVGCFGIILHFSPSYLGWDASVPFVMWRLDNGRLNGQYILNTETLEMLSESR